MYCLLLSTIVLQLPPGPLDAYRANYAAIKVQVEYEITVGPTDYRNMVQAGRFVNDAVAFVPERFQTAVGMWACDGTAEHFRCEPLIKDRDAYPKSGKLTLYYFHPFELVCDEQKAAWMLGPRYDKVHMADTKQPPVLVFGRSALFRWNGYSLPSWLEKEFPGATPVRRTSSLDGRPMEVEVYQTKAPAESSYRLEVWYDPAIGYLPRLTREVSSSGTVATLVEKRVTDVRLCAAGGFVPTEWYEIATMARGIVMPSQEQESSGLWDQAKACTVHHFKTSRFSELTSPISLENTKQVRVIGNSGGIATFKKGALASLSLNQAHTIARRKGGGAGILSPATQAELDEDNQPASRRWYGFSGLAVGVGIITVGVYWYANRRKRVHYVTGLVALTIAAATSGCRHDVNPGPQLKASFRPAKLICGPGEQELKLTMAVRNDGRASIRVLGIDGGCTCRQVDKSQFPVRLLPGGEIEVTTQVKNPRTFDRNYIQYSLETDQGAYGLRVPLYAIPRHYMEPDAITNNSLVGDDAWSFEFTHREVVENDNMRTKCHAEVKEINMLTIQEVGTSEGKLDEIGYRYRDTKYQATLKNSDMGLHKAIIRMTGNSRDTLIEMPVVWRRVSFLSSVPERAILGARPVRVFLRCPDEAVELTRVLAASPGLKAVVSSTREVTIGLEEGAPSVIDGYVDVATTASERPSLRIPVVRYSPVAQHR